MATPNQRQVPPLYLDLQNKLVWKGEERLRLTPRAFAVLRCLMEHVDKLVTKEDLFKAVWQADNVVVGDDAITTCVYEVRRALKEEAAHPQYIETVPKYGYRFIGPVTADPPLVSSSKFQVPSSRPYPAPSVQHPAPTLVGREVELVQLHKWSEKARLGERQVVFVTGEPGIGKTSLVDAFAVRLADDPTVWVTQGQCIEQYGEGEPYLPVLEAMGRLSRRSGVERLVEFLGHYAPTWLVQMPTLVGKAELETLQRQVQGATRQRMLREIVEAVEIFTRSDEGREPPLLVLVLEDLQWSDYSTLDLIASLARRREPARLLVIGTYRPAEGLAEGRPLRALIQELRGHELCHELAVSLLGKADVDAYLEKRFPTSVLPDRLPQLLYQLTEGNPLFLVTLVNDWVDRQVLLQTEGVWTLQNSLDVVTADVPDNLRQLLGKQSDRLTPQEQRLLEVASVAGLEFSAAAVAAAAAIDVVEVERSCKGLADRQLFLRSAGISEWPDSTVAARYGFRHALYQYLWNERVTTSQLQQFHQRIGERLENAYGSRAGEIAAELAVHFEQGRDYPRIVRYLQEAAGNAMRRSAYQEAVSHLTKGIGLLKTLPASPERPQQELVLQIARGLPLLMIKGHTDPDVEKTYARARELSRQIGETPQLLQVLFGLRRFYFAKGELRIAHELGEQFLNLARNVRESVFILWAHCMLGETFFYFGELGSAQVHLEQGIVPRDLQDHRSRTFLYGYDNKMGGLYCLARTLWLRGYPDQARKRNQEAFTLASEIVHPFSLATGLNYAAVVHQFCGETRAVQERAEAAIALSIEQGFPFWEAWGRILQGWTLVEQGQKSEGITQLRHGLAVHQAMGAENSRPYALALLAEAYGKAGQAEDGLSTVTEALAAADKTGDRVYEVELYRLKGTLTLQSKVQSPRSKVPSTQRPTPGLQAEAEVCFHKAIEIARRQSAKSLELRATASLARLWQQQGKKAQARKVLAESYGWFTEGFDTADLVAAKALLEELS